MILIFLLVLLFISCSTNSEVRFAGYECWNFKVGDLVLDNNEYLEEYEEFRYIESTNVPLTKTILLDSELVFIGLTPKSNASLISVLKKDSSFINNHFGKFHIFLKKQDLFLIKVIYFQEKIEQSIVLNFLTKDSTKAYNIFLDEKILNSLECN